MTGLRHLASAHVLSGYSSSPLSRSAGLAVANLAPGHQFWKPREAAAELAPKQLKLRALWLRGVGSRTGGIGDVSHGGQPPRALME